MFVSLFHQHIDKTKPRRGLWGPLRYMLVSRSQADSWQWPYTNNNT